MSSHGDTSFLIDCAIVSCRRAKDSSRIFGQIPMEGLRVNGAGLRPHLSRRCPFCTCASTLAISGNRILPSCNWKRFACSCPFVVREVCSRAGQTALIYPVSFDELCWASLKRAVIRYLSFSPLLTAYGAGAALVVHASPILAINVSLMPLAILLAAQPIIDCLKLSNGTNDTKRVSMWVLLFGGGGAFVLAAFVALIAPIITWRCAALVLCAVLAAECGNRIARPTTAVSSTC